MVQNNYQPIVLMGVAATLGLALPMATLAQLPPRPASAFFQGRGVAHDAVFSRGRNANVSLTLDGDNYSLEMTEILPSNPRNQPPGRVQYRGAILRRADQPDSPNSFSLSTRVRSFDSSANLRILTNTTGTCRIDVFNSRVISSSCTTVADDSSTQFLGLEQF